MKFVLAKLTTGVLVLLLAVGAVWFFGSQEAQASHPFPTPAPGCPQCVPEFCDGLTRCVLISCEEDCEYYCAFDFTCRFF